MNNYEDRLKAAKAALIKAQDDIEFLELQIKEEKRQDKWAATSPIIKQLRKLFPTIEIENGAGTTYLTLRLSVLDSKLEDRIPKNWECFEVHSITSSFGSPIQRTYRSSGVPALLYVIQQIR